MQGWVLDEDDYEAMPSDDEKEEQLAAKNAAAERLRPTSGDSAAVKVHASTRQFVTKSSIKKSPGYAPRVS